MPDQIAVPSAPYATTRLSAASVLDTIIQSLSARAASTDDPSANSATIRLTPPVALPVIKCPGAPGALATTSSMTAGVSMAAGTVLADVA